MIANPPLGEVSKMESLVHGANSGGIPSDGGANNVKGDKFRGLVGSKCGNGVGGGGERGT